MDERRHVHVNVREIHNSVQFALIQPISCLIPLVFSRRTARFLTGIAAAHATYYYFIPQLTVPIFGKATYFFTKRKLTTAFATSVSEKRSLFFQDPRLRAVIK